MDHDDLYERFSHHTVTVPEAIEEMHVIREELLSVARVISPFLPDGREKSLFLTKLEEAMFWANASIARQSPAE